MQQAGARRVQQRHSTTALRMFASLAPRTAPFASMKQVADLVRLPIFSPMAPASPALQTAQIAQAQQTALFAELPIFCQMELVVLALRTARPVQALRIALFVPPTLLSYKTVYADHALQTARLAIIQPAAHHAALQPFSKMECAPAVPAIVAIAPVQLTAHRAKLQISCLMALVVRAHRTARIAQARPIAPHANPLLLFSKTVFADLVLLIAQPVAMQRVVHNA